MARYSSDHKAQTKAHILDVARREFRENGFERPSIDSLMAAAGLTRGAFYAHFASKEALVEAVLEDEPGLLSRLHAVGSRSEAVSVLTEYLADETRTELPYCALVAHAMDARRGPDERSALYQRQIEGILDSLSNVMDDETAAISTILAVGAGTLSAAVDEELGQRLLDAARRAIARLS